MVGKTTHYVTDKEMFKHLGNAVDNMTGLGFTGKQVGTHSIRSILAMALYLARRSVPTIMLLGRWCSDAFLLYVRRQVQEFSACVSIDMVANERFFTIPNLDKSLDINDPRTRNNLSFGNTMSLNGPNAPTLRAQRPAVHVYH